MPQLNLPAIRKEDLVEKFKNVSRQLPKFRNISEKVKVQDDESLAIAENNIAEIKTLMKDLDGARKRLKKPYADVVTMIDGYAKIISDQFESFRKQISLHVVSYREVQEAAARVEMEKRKRETEQIEKEKQEEADRLIRLTEILNAKLYGGPYKTKNGDKMSDGCYTKEECDLLMDSLDRSFPPSNSFRFYPDRRDEVYARAKKKITAHKIDLIDLESENKEIRMAALKRINEAKIKAGLDVEKTNDELAKTVQRDVRKELKDAQKEVKLAAKGTRKILKFRVVDEEQVTREFLSVDEMKIRDWMENQHSDIKEMLLSGSQPLKGIEFYVETTFVSR